VRRADPVVALAVVLVAAGIAARFVALDRHYYFHDEAVTSLRVSGHTYADLDRFTAGRTLTVVELGAFQRPSGRGVGATIHSLAVDDPQHPPLYYLGARLWASAAGASITATRAFAALLSLLALAAGAWLAFELFGSRRVAWATAALLAVSPFQLLYAREAREYGLWVAAAAGSGAALMRALRHGSRASWTLYALLVALSLYTFPNTGLVVVGHGAFLLLQGRVRAVLRPFGLALLAAGVLYLPWLGVMLLERGALTAGTDWAGGSIPFAALLRSWLVASGLPVLDKAGGTASLGVAWGAGFAAVLALEAAALALVRRRGPRPAWLFLACTICATAAPLMLADLAFGGVRSTVPRFLAPAYLGVSVALAFALVEATAARSRRAVLAAAAAALAVVAAGAVSYERSAFAAVWWNQDDGAAEQNLAAARVLDRFQKPVLLTTATLPLLELAHYLEPGARVAVVAAGAPLPRVEGDDVFFYGPARPPGGERLSPVPLELPCCDAGLSPGRYRLWRVLR
jgi:uncharacterized membrane protein